MRQLGKRGWILGGIGAVLLSAPVLQAFPLQAQPQEPTALAGAAGTALSGDEWAAKVWRAAADGKQAELEALLARSPVADQDYTDSLTLLNTHVEERETKRAERIEKVGKRLDEQMAEATSDLGISVALQSAIELNMLSKDKASALQDPRVKTLVASAEEAAKDRDAEPEPVTHGVPVPVGATSDSSFDSAFGDDDLDIPDFLK